MGIDVVSALGNPAFPHQIPLAKAAKEGVKLFVPSEYGLDASKFKGNYVRVFPNRASVRARSITSCAGSRSLPMVVFLFSHKIDTAPYACGIAPENCAGFLLAWSIGMEMTG